MQSETLSIQPLRSDEVGLLHELVCELAKYERLSNSVSSRAEDLRNALFGERPILEALLARNHEETLGFGTFYMTFSTFRGRPGLYVEDLYVREAARGQGVGRALMGHMARTAMNRGCDRMSWSVLDWNESAHAFYRSLGATMTSDWLPYGLSGEALGRLARIGKAICSAEEESKVSG